MPRENYISTKEAQKRANVTHQTVVNWCKKYGIGRKVVGRWRVDPEALENLLVKNWAGMDCSIGCPRE